MLHGIDPSPHQAKKRQLPGTQCVTGRRFPATVLNGAQWQSNTTSVTCGSGDTHCYGERAAQIRVGPNGGSPAHHAGDARGQASQPRQRGVLTHARGSGIVSNNAFSIPTGFAGAVGAQGCWNSTCTPPPAPRDSAPRLQQPSRGRARSHSALMCVARAGQAVGKRHLVSDNESLCGGTKPSPPPPPWPRAHRRGRERRSRGARLGRFRCRMRT
jgi:hypothetical protein